MRTERGTNRHTLDSHLYYVLKAQKVKGIMQKKMRTERGTNRHTLDSL